jgi:hypothetical protein
MKRIALCIMCLFCIIVCYAQNTKHNILSGKVVFVKMKNDSIIKDSPKVTYWFMPGRAKIETDSAGSISTLIADIGKEDGVLLVEIKKRKLAVNFKKEEFRKRLPVRFPNALSTRESKSVAGSYCLKSLVSKDADTSVAWYSDMIKANNLFAGIPKLNGFVLEWPAGSEGEYYTAQTTDFTDLDASAFKKPEDYKTISLEEYRQLSKNK